MYRSWRSRGGVAADPRDVMLMPGAAIFTHQPYFESSRTCRCCRLLLWIASGALAGDDVHALTAPVARCHRHAHAGGDGALHRIVERLR